MWSRTTSRAATSSSPTGSGCAASRSTRFCRSASSSPASEVPDPQALGIRAILNGEVMQDSNTSNMVFGVAEIIAFVSQGITLEPGDLIITGTPAGVGRSASRRSGCSRATRSRSRSTASGRSRTRSPGRASREAGAAARRVVPGCARAAAPARRHRSSVAAHPGQPGHHARGRGTARDDPGALHGALRPAGAVRLGPDRASPGGRALARADRRLRGRTGDRPGRDRCDPVDDPDRRRDGDRGRDPAGDGEGALRRPPGLLRPASTPRGSRSARPSPQPPQFRSRTSQTAGVHRCSSSARCRPGSPCSGSG